MEEYEDARSCRSQKGANDADALILQQPSEGMLGKAAVVSGILEQKQGQSESIDEEEEEDFIDEKNPSEDGVMETEFFIAKFCTAEGNAYRLCPEKWTINDQGFGTDVTCCNGECRPKSFQDIMKEVKRISEGLQTQMSEREIFFKWAVSQGRQRN